MQKFTVDHPNMRRKSLLKFCGISFVSLSLAACSLTPRYERPAAPVASSYPGALPGTGAGVSQRTAAEIPWREFFHDPRLVSLIELALVNNRDLRIAAANIDRARALFQIQRADRLPTLNATAQGVSQRSSGATTPSGNPVRLDYLQSALGVTAFELDFFGRVRALGDSALAQYLSTEEAAESAQVSLVGTIANTWLALIGDHETISLTRKTLESREQSLKLARLRQQNGVVSALDVRQAETLLESARATLAQLQRQRDLNRNALVLLIGQPLSAEYTDEPPSGTGVERSLVMAEVPAGLPSDLLTRRPDVLAAEQQLIAANANIGAARAALFPRIALTSSFGTASSNLSELLSAPSRFWSIVPSALLPIFDSGRNQANVDASVASREAALAQYEKSIQVAFREVADALSSRSALNDQVTALQAQQTAESERLRLVETRYKGGVGNSLDVLDAQRSLFAVQQSLIVARLATLQTQVNLYRALGGGWSSADQRATR